MNLHLKKLILLLQSSEEDRLQYLIDLDLATTRHKESTKYGRYKILYGHWRPSRRTPQLSV